MNAAYRIILFVLCGLLLVSCARFTESRFMDSSTATLSLPQPLPPGCIERALEEVFGAGSARPNAQRSRIVVAAFPWEGYVTARPSGDGLVNVAVELTKVNRYQDGRGSLSSELEQAAGAIAGACMKKGSE